MQEHYQELLAPRYAWLCGGLDANLRKYRRFFQKHGIRPLHSALAVDLGAGCGFQSIPLAEAGFKVIAIDLNPQLLAQLENRSAHLPVATIQADLLNFTTHSPPKVELIVCMGDTLTHLNTVGDVRQLIEKVYPALEQNGLFILGFRDMSVELTGLARFILLRSDSKRIFSCFLEFEKRHVKVHDILYEKTDEQWELKKSFFRKLRIPESWAVDCLQKSGFAIESKSSENGMLTLLARKG